jgi:two-component system, sensor histidine kinase PdtaS
MFQLEKLLGARTTITIDQANRIRELVADWQLLADLSFADLILWVPIRKDVSMWPTGHIAVAHIRPTTTSTVLINDVVGDELLWGAKPAIDEALSGDEIVKASDPEKIGEMLVKTETIPVTFGGQVIAVISSHRNVDHSRGSGKLESNYREVAQHLFQMVAQGSFPFKDAGSLFEPVPRVGDGLIRLDANSAISFASPNAKSAFSRMGWRGDLEGRNLGEVAEQVVTASANASEQGVRSRLNGKELQRVEIDNQGATIDLLVLPLIVGTDKIGAIVLLQNVTELRRRDRELVTKDATIREIHHRVKNNLQTVSALLRLQSRRIEDPAAAAALDEAVRRIASIAVVHETLSNSTQTTVAFDEVLSSLVTHALELSPRMSELTIERTGEIGSLESRVATPLSLVVTELIHNALEHGLYESGTKLRIELQRYSNEALVTISDDGIGLPDGFDLLTSANLGLQIVRTLTENELKGELKLESTDKGTQAKLRFPL